MKLSDKIMQLRKANGWSQEELAENLNVSRQAISRWENGTALPDANNILQLSKLFKVTADYLLNEDYTSDGDTQCIKETPKELHSPKSIYRKLSLIASVVFLIGAFICLFQAINYLEIVYVILSLVNAFVSGFCVLIYEKLRTK